MPLTYRRTRYPSGIVEIAGTWAAWREQIPALPADPGGQLDRDTTVSIIRHPLTYQRDGEPVTATLSTVRIVRIKLSGELAAIGTLAELDETPTRRGRCQVCEAYRDDLIERRDASGLTGWVCEEHDDLDIVFA